jgi:hypothetical protein
MRGLRRPIPSATDELHRDHPRSIAAYTNRLADLHPRSVAMRNVKAAREPLGRLSDGVVG